VTKPNAHPSMIDDPTVVRPAKDDDGWLRIPVIATVDDMRYQAVCEYRTPAEGPVVKDGAGCVIPGHLISRIQSVEGYMREQSEDPRASWPPKMPGRIPAGMNSGF
jgi:hypothetical protein